jgi:type VI secretion system secreted protein Hcp
LLQRTAGDGSRVKYFKIELENVLISIVNPTSANGGIITESIHLASSKFKCSYVQQKIAGGAGEQTTGGWDSAANKVYA